MSSQHEHAIAPCLEYEALLLQLHVLDQSGELDSPEADDLREQMDRPWANLSERERQLMSGLSHDLYDAKEDAVSHDGMGLGEPELLGHLQAAYEAERWDALLALLRRARKLVPSDRIAYIRGRCWSELNHPSAAARFFEQAHRRDPENDRYAIILLDAWTKAGQQEVAITLAEQILASSKSTPTLLFGAAKTLFDGTKGLASEEARPRLERVVKAITKALQAERGLPPSARIPSLSLAARINLAIAKERLGHLKEAREEYDSTVRDHPESDEALMARALFFLRADPDSAQGDLLELVRRGTSLTYPYFFLAHRALQEDRFDDCIGLCGRGLLCRGPRSVLASMIEWIAISQYHLGAPAAIVRASFEAALTLDPLSERIRGNLETFQSEDAGGRTHRPTFRTEPTQLKLLEAETAQHLVSRLDLAA